MIELSKEELIALREPKPIGMMFSCPMIQSIILGNKSQTRRKSARVKVGQVIYVKEKYALNLPGYPQSIAYEADFYNESGDRNPPTKWRNPMFMPKAAARIFLRCTDVGEPEKVQDISEEDAIAEGLASFKLNGEVRYGLTDWWGYPKASRFSWDWEDWERSPIDAFRKLWCSLHGKDSWDANPLVFPISFDSDCSRYPR